jgi:ADP-ribose pyrophosphatase YjhB (NUDIX family)
VAIVTETSTENPDLPVDTVALCVLNPADVTVITQASYSATPQAGCWSLP